MKQRATPTHGADPLPTGGRRVGVSVFESANYADGSAEIHPDILSVAQLRDHLGAHGEFINGLTQAQRLLIANQVEALLTKLQQAKICSDRIRQTLLDLQSPPH